ncbi:MAG: MFS transporter [Gaiellaceae bacterium]
MRYRWAVLAAGTIATASAAVLFIGLPVLAPTLREEYSLSLAQIGVLLAAAWVGTTLTLLPWGLAADRFGERVVLTIGLAGCAICLLGAAFAPSATALFFFLALAGASGASVNSASGRAVMHWFGPDERGLALGVRQTAIPLGGFVGALALPAIAGTGGSEAAFGFLTALCAAGALVGVLVLRDRDVGHELEAATILRTLGDTRLWRLSVGGGLYLYAQLAVIGFGVLFLHDEHGFSDGRAALVVAASQVLGAIFRIGAGRWSDVLGQRVVLLRGVGLAVAAALVVVAALAGGPVWLLVPALALAGGLSMAWNGLSFTAAAELAGPLRSGAALGFQQTALSGAGVAAPVLFAASVATMSWPVAFALAALFPLAGWLVLGALRGH